MDFSSLPDQMHFLRADVVATVIEGGAVLLDLQSKFFYSANEQRMGHSATL
jgi:hypothetical protein